MIWKTISALTLGTIAVFAPAADAPSNTPPPYLLYDASGNPYPHGSGTPLTYNPPPFTCYTNESGSVLPCDFSGGGGSVSITSSNGSLTVSPSPLTGTGTIDLNLGHANTWTAQQIFDNADIPDATFLNFGSATTGIRSLQVAGQMDFYVLGANVAALGNTGTWQMVTGGGFSWGTIRGTQDTSLYRTAAKTISIGVGGDATGTLKYALYTPGVIYSAAGTALPSCSSTTKGTTAVVSDATTPTYMSAYTSGGAITAAVICSYDGTTYSWLTH